MFSILLATMLVATPLPTETYTNAREIVTKTEQPLVILVSTDWCRPCQKMKRIILPAIHARGILKKVIFATVNPDQEKDLADRLTEGGPIPQLLLFRKTHDGWVRKKLIGEQTVESVEEFITK
jgi:thioredoxin-like negative regulator of GroEL